MKNTNDHSLCSSVPFFGGVNLLVGVSGSSPINSNPVALNALSPNHQGCTIDLGSFPKSSLAWSCITGFSIAILGIGASLRAL